MAVAASPWPVALQCHRKPLAHAIDWRGETLTQRRQINHINVGWNVLHSSFLSTMGVCLHNIRDPVPEGL